MNNENDSKFMKLGIVRYSVTQRYNANLGWLLDVPNNDMDVTYQTLIVFHSHRLYGDDDAQRTHQVLRNHTSTLNGYLAYLGKTVESFIGREFRHAFDEKVAGFLSALGQTAKTLSDKRSHLRAWKTSIDLLLASSAEGNIPLRPPRAFHQALREAVASTGLAAKALARECDISPSALQRWLAGAEPNRTTLTSLRRLENHIGLERGTLEKLLARQPQSMASPMAAPPDIAYRQRHRQSTADSYRLKDNEFPPSLIAEWRDFLLYKTATHTRIARRPKAIWRLLPEVSLQRPLSTHAYIHGQGCPTADVVLGWLSSYFGYLRLNVAKGGMGLPKEHALTLAALVVPEWLENFLLFVRRRAQGKTHRGHAIFAGLVTSLVRADTGYLAQKPLFITRLPTDVTQGRSWEQLCQEAQGVASAWKQAATDVSRDPGLPIQPLLSLDEPLAPVLRMVRELDQAAAAALPGSTQQALHKRDALLVSLALVNPLRLRTLTLTTYDGNAGNLYQRGREWRLRFQGNDFKNDNGSRLDDYDAVVLGLNERIEEYLFEYRPILIKHCPECPFLFPSTRNPNGKHCGLDLVVRRLTRRYLPEVQSFGPHAFRHLVASAYLKKHPKDFLTVAQILHDELTTVMKHYAHLATDDAFGRYAEHLATLNHQSKT